MLCYLTFITTLFMKLVPHKGYKGCHEWLLRMYHHQANHQVCLNSLSWNEIDANRHLLLTTKMFQNQRWNLVSIKILVAHEFKNSYINGHVCLYTHRQIYGNSPDFHLFNLFLLTKWPIAKLLNYIGLLAQLP